MTPPRRLEILPLGQALLCVAFIGAGFVAGLAISARWPMGFAPELPPRQAGDDRPQPGRVLTAGASSALVYSDTVHELRDGARVAGVVWLRGPRSGREVIRLTGCAAGAGHMESLTEPDRRAPWRSDGGGIVDLVAQAVCHGTEPPLPAKPTT